MGHPAAIATRPGTNRRNIVFLLFQTHPSSLRKVNKVEIIKKISLSSWTDGNSVNPSFNISKDLISKRHTLVMGPPGFSPAQSRDGCPLGQCTNTHKTPLVLFAHPT